MGTDIPDSMGMRLTQGNNVYISREPDTRAETERLYAALSEGGTVEMPLQEMFWGGYFASLMDRFGTRWMLNCASKTCRGAGPQRPTRPARRFDPAQKGQHRWRRAAHAAEPGCGSCP